LEGWDLKGLSTRLIQQFGTHVDFSGMEVITPDALIDKISNALKESYLRKVEMAGDDGFKNFERDVFLYTIDTLWQDHLLDMDHLKEGIGLRGYGQRDPLVEYKREAFELFEQLQHRIAEECTHKLCSVQIAAPKEAVKRRPMVRPLAMRHEEASAMQAAAAAGGGGVVSARAAMDGNMPAQPAEEKVKPIHRDHPKVGRNQPCPCGSGKKYKHCCYPKYG
jgi:preprotein translocase subunit SecA